MRKFVDALVALGPLGIFALAAIDSAGIPLPGGVDALLLLVSVKSPGDAWLAAAGAVLGSLCGNWILYSIARKGGEAYLEAQTHEGRGRTLKEWFLRYGLVTIFVPALLPIPMPMKVPVICSAALGVSRNRFLAVVAAARIPRYFGLAWLGLQLGQDAGTWMRAHAWHAAGFALLLFALLGGLIRLSDRRQAAA